MPLGDDAALWDFLTSSTQPRQRGADEGGQCKWVAGHAQLGPVAGIGQLATLLGVERDALFLALGGDGFHLSLQEAGFIDLFAMLGIKPLHRLAKRFVEAQRLDALGAEARAPAVRASMVSFLPQ